MNRHRLSRDSRHLRRPRSRKLCVRAPIFLGRFSFRFDCLRLSSKERLRYRGPVPWQSFSRLVLAGPVGGLVVVLEVEGKDRGKQAAGSRGGSRGRSLLPSASFFDLQDHDDGANWTRKDQTAEALARNRIAIPESLLRVQPQAVGAEGESAEKNRGSRLKLSRTKPPKMAPRPVATRARVAF